MKSKLLLVTMITSIGFVKSQVQGNYLYSQASGNYVSGIQMNENYNQNYFNNSIPASKTEITNNQEITIEVNGLMNIVVDRYVAIFNIIQVAETITETDKLMNNRIFELKSKLKALGIDTNEIKIDMISFIPKYDILTENKLFSKAFNEVPLGFELQKNISISYKNSNKLDEIVSAATSSEIYDLVKVDYFFANTQKMLDSLRLKCINEIKFKTKSYEIIGFRLDTLKKTFSDNFITIYPPTRYLSYQAFSRPSLNALKKKNSVQPTLVEVPKSTSKFYSQVSYDKYDIIINPIINEPVVQISYSIVVKYFLTPEITHTKSYYILNQTGDAKQFYPK